MTASDAEPQDGIKRRLVTVSDGRQVNYRRAGSGASLRAPARVAAIGTVGDVD